MAPLTIIITMAGQGDRFRKAGYTVPKYEIEVNGKTLFHWAVTSLSAFFSDDAQLVFIAREEFEPDRFIRQECQKIGISNFSIVLLDELTDGQATTVLAAQDVITDKNAPVLIYNIDTHVNPDTLSLSQFPVGEGWIPCFLGKGDGWSFVRTDEKNKAVEVREKKRISPYATIGLYGFPSFSKYEMAYHQYYSDLNNLEFKERYVAPLYNQCIRDGEKIAVSVLPDWAVLPLGTPDEVEDFRHASRL